MSKKHHPRRGSMAYSPRKRAKSEVPRFHSWPKGGKEVKIQGFAGYKAGMTHAFVKDYRPTSTTTGQEVQIPVTIIEVPPLMVAAVRTYKNTPSGLKVDKEIWAKKLNKELGRKISMPKKKEKTKTIRFKKEIDDIRILVYTQPRLVTGIPKKKPELMEVRIGGGTIEERLKYAKLKLGKSIDIKEFAKDGMMVDIAAITKGKGFQGAVKRWGVKLLTHKNSKHRRMVGTLGPWHPAYVNRAVPQAGQMGYHQRTEFNKRILEIGDNGEKITPNGGFIRYGIIRNQYVVIHGSIAGPSKRLIRFREPIRLEGVKVEKPEMTYISRESKQGA